MPEPPRLRIEFRLRTGLGEQAGAHPGVSAAARRAQQRCAIYNPGPEPASVKRVVQPAMPRHDRHQERHAACGRLQQGRAVDVAALEGPAVDGAAVDSVLSSELEFMVRGFQTLVASHLR